ncbi:MAG: hypothetical protein NVS2B16_36900 [Chloroflexota bacterium]
MAYLRIGINTLKHDVGSPEVQAMGERIRTEGIAFLRQQPGFVRFQVVEADSRTVITVLEWASESQGKVGVERWSEWLQSHGSVVSESFQSYGGDVIISS